MFDIHYHLIFGVDDGPKSIEDSLELAEASIAEGVTHIVATPHASHNYLYQAELNRERLDTLKERLAGRLALGLGCDFHLSFDNLTVADVDPRQFTINGSSYLLVEFPDQVHIPVYNEVLFRLMSRGIVPIITHPERNETLKEKPETVLDWVHAGCLVQVTAASYLGRFGKRSQTLARDLTRSNLVHFVASDAHNVRTRRPAMADAFQVLKNDFGQQTAERLCMRNPEAVFFGRPLPPQPEIRTARYEKKKMPRKGLFRWLLG